MERCRADEVGARVRAGARVVDVREFPEFVGGHLAGATCIPLSQLQRGARPEPGEVIVVCRTGRRAEQAAQLLEAGGQCRPVLLEGGMDAWRQSGGAVETAKGPIGLERQVRIAAGLLVLAGLAIPHGIWLTAFVGAGLVFAGITDTCAMGMLIAKMPWNRPPRSGRGPEGTDRAAA